MKAAVFRKIGTPFTIEAMADPTPGAGEIVLKVGRCGICGSDLHMTQSQAYEREGGLVFGHEFAGEVVALGRDAGSLATGDRVAALPVTGCGQCSACLAGEPAYCRERRLEFGGFAEYVVARARETVTLPAALTMDDGALIEPLAVGLHGVKLAGMEPGARVLVMGAGPIGLAVAYWARRLGARRIAVMARSSRSAGIALQVGANAFVPQSPQAVEEVRDALGGAPDIVFECGGTPGLIDTCLTHVAPRGAVVVLGILGGLDQITPRTGIQKEARILFSAFYSVRDFAIVADRLASGDTAPRAMITGTVGLDELPDAFEALRQRTSHCKLMLDPWR
jgi:(R,R)-butanediol dehydrogenase / meso-butanediol dehydrogenase / diacetyl reductase